ncbi:hypothetical protein DRJ19_03775 [Candidatus Woesearchaeota archaeon]|nr:MAG: hypothetical protein DRJ19_03775 [Candidatus Woesearchaeota archaeon]
MKKLVIPKIVENCRYAVRIGLTHFKCKITGNVINGYWFNCAENCPFYEIADEPHVVVKDIAG